jgi:hydroxypyruvate reductase/glycerate 2-kinase
VPRPGVPLREEARLIWQAAVEAARPEPLLRATLEARELQEAVRGARRLIVVGAGKAGAAMSAALEAILADDLNRVEGIVNVPIESVRPLRAIQLHGARPAGSNHPTAEGVAGSTRILDLVAAAGPDDLVLCLLSGGGSALLPAPVASVSLADKQAVTQFLHACGATINEMNAVRKHLSRIKGGQLARAFHGRHLYSLIISDVVGDPLDVIASGPTAADPTTFADALAVLDRYRLMPRVPPAVRTYLERGAAGKEPETLKVLPTNVSNCVIGNNRKALAAAQAQAEALGYRVLNLGSYIEGDTRHIAMAFAGIVRSIRCDRVPLPPPVCVLSGGETTVTLTERHGLGGRNQEFVLACLAILGDLRGLALLSGGTDGEDGPTDAAGAVADDGTLARAGQAGFSPADFLNRHDAYHFFAATDDLVRTGLTETNVMDVRVLLVAPS